MAERRKRRLPRPLIVMAIILLALLIAPYFLPVTAANADPRALADPNGAFITLNGATVYYVAYGEADAPAGRLSRYRFRPLRRRFER
jgi:uncharacterized RDD family membrane protein YckC